MLYLSSFRIIKSILFSARNFSLKTTKHPVTIILPPGFDCFIRLISCLALLSLAEVTVQVFIMEKSGFSFIETIRKPRLIKSPVSYTHLRAHETDSYLVCRLL